MESPLRSHWALPPPSLSRQRTDDAGAVGGTVPVAFDNIATAVQHVNAGKLRALGMTSATRSIVSPDVPTMVEAGLTGYDISSWQAAFVKETGARAD